MPARLKIRTFLNNHNLAGASRRFFQGDASRRTYERITHPDLDDQILMNMPQQSDDPIIRDGKTYQDIAHLAKDVIPFLAIGKILRDRGLRVPQIFHSSIEEGILLIEDLGSGQLVERQNIPIVERYLSAIDVLAYLHSQSSPSFIETDKDYEIAQSYGHNIPFYDHDVMQMEVRLLLDWYFPYRQIDITDISLQHQFITIWQTLFDRVKQAETTLVLRDYHSPNLFGLPDKTLMSKLELSIFRMP